MTKHFDPNRRHDFVLLFDVTDGNPNGDPDGGNMPRTDPETLQGLVTDVSLKRKIRNYVATYAAHEAPDDQKARLKIFVEHHGVLNEQIRLAYTEQDIPTGKPADDNIDDAEILAGLRAIAADLPEAFTFVDRDDDASDDETEPANLAYSGELSDTEKKEALEQLEEVISELAIESAIAKKTITFIKNLTKKAGKPDKSRANAEKAQVWMCNNFFDVRMFGAVMSTGLNAGQVRGPVQITFARSIDPVLPQDLAITRMAVTTEADREKLQTMGRKTLIPYGLYLAYGFYSPYLAQNTGVNKFDLQLFWQALVNMWDFDRSASRGLMAPRGLYVFTHESKLGNAPAHKLFERITVRLKNPNSTPRSFKDYELIVNTDNLPDAITLTDLLAE
ncbi:CRISPR-associated protein, Csd2 family [Thalassoporum mexicanum PCC 7367]|uniref:type I-C CRISPR-associated protein Cas7/Csd2 n=1 Tax=Thalassoporum mexicanum TaxID=3457544 RepID=UPI00029FDE3E|nr:type I-C CRISPR-associated protein Cas7/Csd2 [Pseudanabaena sp. PCC 7367]AFY70025.1 CRISPR-associated protein, Csd2 family [Pseudanabaena sp. PCC 7367]